MLTFVIKNDYNPLKHQNIIHTTTPFIITIVGCGLLYLQTFHLPLF